MARALVGITLMLWLIVFFVGVTVVESPLFFLSALYGLYPADMSRRESHLVLMHISAGVTGLVFLTLALTAVRRNSKLAAVAFMALFLISMFRFLVNASDA
jgi:hypothetical protein